jgi:hypothetical protein
MMDADKKAILDALGAVVAEKRQYLNSLGMVNVSGRDEVERMQLTMRYSQAQSAVANAENALRSAIARYGAT